MKSLKLGNVILCEHVVTGGGNKHTLVNVYAGDLLLRDIPGTLLLGVYIELPPQQGFPAALQLEIIVGKEVLASVEVSLEGHDNAKPALVALPVFPVEVKEETVIRAKLKAEGFRSAVVLKRALLKAPGPIA